MSGIFTHEMIDERIKLHMEWVEGGYKDGTGLQMRFIGEDLSELDFGRSHENRPVDLQGAVFSGCNLNFCNFERAGIARGVFIDCTLNKASFDRADLRSALFIRCTMQDTYLREANFSHANIQEVIMDRSYARGALFSHVQFFEEISMKKADLKGASFHGSSMLQVDIAGAYIGETAFSIGETGGYFSIDDDTMRTFFCFLCTLEVECMEEDTWTAMREIQKAASMGSQACKFGILS